MICRERVSAIVSVMLLTVVAIAPRARGQGVVLLGAEQGTAKDMNDGLLIREQVRQAILIAARDEMGLATRDAALRELDPSSADAVGVHLDVARAKSIKVQLLRGGKAVWNTQFPLPTKSTMHVNLTEACEPLSRRQFVDALTAAGFKAAPRPAAKASDALPDGIDGLLAQMNFVAQVDAARRVHESIRTGGESPAKLGALVRAYGNLAALTERQWYAADRVFKARALLYAQRLVAGDVPNAHALWHRAYARAMAGLYGPAADDLAAAAKIADPAKDGGPPPAWVPLLDMLCRYDVAALKVAAARDPAVAPLATLLAMLDLTGAGHGEIIAAGKLALEASPENFFALDRTTTEAGVSYNHTLTRMGPQILIGQTLAKTLPTMVNLPESVQQAIKVLNGGNPITAAQIAAVSQALIAAGDPEKDHGEPSLATVGRLIEDTHFLHIYRRATFVRDQLGGDAGEVGDFVRSQLPLIGADHPYRAFLEHFGVDYRQDPVKYDQFLTSIKPTDPTPPVRQWLGYLKDTPKTRAFKTAQADRLYQFTDYIVRDLELQYTISTNDTWRTQVANQILHVSPRSPFGMGILVSREWETRQAKAAEYETWAPGIAYLQGVLARKYAKDERLEDAARCYKAFLAVSKEWWVYKELADLHLKRGDEAMWLKTLETYLVEGEDYSLTFASTRVEIARELGWRGKYHQALPYAEAAAETGAGWALQAAGECHEALGEFDRAEAFYRSSAAAYDAEAFKYWRWEWRRGTGGADLARAERAVLDYIANNKVVDPDEATTFYLLKGDREAAFKIFRGIDEPTLSSLVGLHMALAADEAGDAALRDQAIERVSKQLRAARTRVYFINLAKLFRDALSAPGKGVDMKKLDALIESHDRETRVHLYEMAGRFLLKHGDKETAIKYLKAAIQGPSMNYTHFNLAWYALKGQGLDPRTLRDPVKD